MIKEFVDRVKNDPSSFLSDYTPALEALRKIGLLNYLRKKGRPVLQVKGVQEAALLGSYSAGWNDCLDVLENFKDLVIAPELDKPDTPSATFGSLNRAMEEGDLSKEEANAIRNGTKPNYQQFTGTPGNYTTRGNGKSDS